jgi:hypothetical protein
LLEPEQQLVCWLRSLLYDISSLPTQFGLFCLAISTRYPASTLPATPSPTQCTPSSHPGDVRPPSSTVLLPTTTASQLFDGFALQRVLDHCNPVTTQGCYLPPLPL